ncbi:hypothetical protein I7I48_01137 [Histoplasma ohiense]|nr:hypothetical protein I7I48_01137 [Histoplasma ohiense (nom. inval.)]
MRTSLLSLWARPRPPFRVNDVSRGIIHQADSAASVSEARLAFCLRPIGGRGKEGRLVHRLGELAALSI